MKKWTTGDWMVCGFVVICMTIAVTAFIYTPRRLPAVPHAAIHSPGVPPSYTSPLGRPDSIISIKQFQQFLTDAGYYTGKIAGYLSPDWEDSKTQDAWDRMYNDSVNRKLWPEEE